MYKAEVLKDGESEGSGHLYIGMASGEFKIRHRNHTKSFRLENYEKETELSKFVWSLKRKNISFKVNFSILSCEKPYRKETGSCNLCSKEKIEIIRNIKLNGSKSLNRRWEVFRKCIHRGNHMLGSINTLHKAQNDDTDRRRLETFMEMPSGQTRSGRSWRGNS